MKKYKTPVIIGVAQYTQYKSTINPLDPLYLMEKTAHEALNDSGSSELVDILDSVYMINIYSWSYKDAPGELSKLLGFKPKNKVYLPDGGNTPQMLMNRASKNLAHGKANAILITGAEAYYSFHKNKLGELNLSWPVREEPKYMEGKMWHGITPFENKYKLRIPPYSYALFETAIRANNGESIQEHNNLIGSLFQHFSEVASNNSHAWTNDAFSAEKIIEPNPNNRYVCHPYTKRMCSNMFIDQSSSVIITTIDIAESLNINESLWIYPMGGADLQNIFAITQRPNLYDSPALKEASKLALKQAGLTLNEINAFDLYSCFPSIVQIALNEIGISKSDSRPLTLTGGLPFFGGPWSNYSLHAIVKAVEIIRKNSMFKILIFANGGYNTKASIGIYGKEPSQEPWGKRNDVAIQKFLLSDPLPKPIEKANGIITIEAYTIIYNKEGLPTEGIAIGKLNNGIRTLAKIQSSNKILKELEKEELVGKKFEVFYHSKKKENIIDLKDFN